MLQKALEQPVVDPRFNMKRGSAEYVQWLGQKKINGYGWATAKIMEIISAKTIFFQ